MLSLFEIDLVITEVHNNEVGRGHCVSLIPEPEPEVSWTENVSWFLKGLFA